MAFDIYCHNYTDILYSRFMFSDKFQVCYTSLKVKKSSEKVISKYICLYLLYLLFLKISPSFIQHLSKK